MKKIKLTSEVGIISVMMGLLWIFFSLIDSPFNPFSKEADIITYFCVSFVMLLIAIPGILAVYFGVRLVKEASKKNIKRTVGSCSIMLTFTLLELLLDFIDKFIKTKSSIYSFALLIILLFIIPVYVYFSKFLMLKENITPIKGEFIGKGIVFFLAWDIYLSFTQLFNDYDHIKEYPWESLSVFGPIVIAVSFYQLTMFLFYKKIKEKNEKR